MAEVNTFKTKNGYCLVYPDKLILTKETDKREHHELEEKNNVFILLAFYFIIGGYLIYNGYNNFVNGHGVTGGIIVAIGLSIFYLVFQSSKNSNTPIIRRDSITRIYLIQGKEGFTRSRFLIEFTDSRNKKRKRLIIINGNEERAKGVSEEEKAKCILEESGYKIN